MRISVVICGDFWDPGSPPDLVVGTKATEELLELVSAPHQDFPPVVLLLCDPAIPPFQSAARTESSASVANAQNSRDGSAHGCSRSNRSPHETFNVLIVCPNCLHVPNPPLLHFCPQLLPLNCQPCTRVPSSQETSDCPFSLSISEGYGRLTLFRNQSPVLWHLTHQFQASSRNVPNPAANLTHIMIICSLLSKSFFISFLSSSKAWSSSVQPGPRATTTNTPTSAIGQNWWAPMHPMPR